MPIDWSGIQTAYLDLQRRRLGLPSREELAMKRAAEARAQATSESALKTADLNRQKIQAEIAAMPGEQALDREYKQSVITRNLREPHERAEPSSMLERIMALPPEQQAAAIKLQRQLNPPPASTGYAIGPPVTVSDAQGNAVVLDRRTGQPIGAAAPTAEQRNRVAGMGRAAGVLDAIEQLSGEINTGEGGITTRATGMARRGAAAAGYDPTVRQYRSLVRGFTPLFARAVGHTGVLTEQDVQRTEELFPSEGDSAGEAQRKLTQVRAIIAGETPMPFRFGGTSEAPAGGATTTVRSQSEYEALPSGTIFFTPDGRRKRKP